ncbi:Crp/Fnr family transcriptional regulator [Hippea alviniae]|uniref:Crp/Fnr family transcriptional regulator n=1 Tax=Hippea alviniae TaxID=1279027 RepID=UPI0003B7308D|nr:Crp/Fnr family transcriptional regulator [Hippea alviniae]
MDKKEAIELFLDALDIKDDKLINDINAVSWLINKQKKEVIFLEGSKGNSMFFVVKGFVKLFKTSEDGKEVVINIIGKGETFAEIVLFLQDTYPVSAEAIEDTLLLEINSNRLFEKIKENPEFAMKLLGVFAQRLNFMAKRIKELSLDDAEERLISYLNNLKDEKNMVVLSIPKKELATAIGVSAETLSRLFKKLKDKGIIDQKGKEIKLKR